MFKTSLLIENEEVTVTINDIKSNSELKLSKTDQAKVNRPGVALLQMVGSVHDTIKKYAVL
jgi:hypothetical protein